MEALSILGLLEPFIEGGLRYFVNKRKTKKFEKALKNSVIEIAERFKYPFLKSEDLHRKLLATLASPDIKKEHFMDILTKEAKIERNVAEELYRNVLERFWQIVKEEASHDSKVRDAILIYMSEKTGVEITLLRAKVLEILGRMKEERKARKKELKRIDQRLETILTRLPGETEVEIPKIPDDIQALFDEGHALHDEGKYEDARSIYQKSLELAVKYEHKLAIARAKCKLANILIYWDHNTADAEILFQEALKEFKSANSETDVVGAFLQLGQVERLKGNLDQAGAYFSQALELATKKKMKLDIATALLQLGIIEDMRGHSERGVELYDQALKRFLSVFYEHDPETEKTAIIGVAECYEFKARVYHHQGKVEETESSLSQALDYYRKSDSKIEVAKVLYLLADLKYAEAQYDQGNQFLGEAGGIFAEIRDYRNVAKCLALKSNQYFALGQTNEAITLMESSLAAIEKTGDSKEKVMCLNTLGHVYLEAQKIDQARKHFEQSRDLSLQEGFAEGCVSAILGLAQIAYMEKDEDKKNMLLSDSIQVLEKLLRSIQAEPQRAFIVGQIGFLHEGMGNYQQALIYYDRAKRSFQSLSDINGIAKCMISIARVKEIVGKKDGNLGMLNEVFEIYLQIKKLLAGSPYYNMIAETEISLGNIYLEHGFLMEARTLLQDAEFLCQRYNLPYLRHVGKLMEDLEQNSRVRKPPELSFEQLVEELFELVNWFPEAKDNILRYWMYGRIDELLCSLRNTANVKFMICQDDTSIFISMSRAFRSFSDLCLQVVSCEYPGSGLDTVPVSKKQMIFPRTLIPFIRRTDSGEIVSVGNIRHHRPTKSVGEPVNRSKARKLGWIPKDAHFPNRIFNSRHFFIGETIRSRVTGNEAAVMITWSAGLPDQAHQLILSKSAAELIAQKIFFLPYQRHLANDKLLSDMRFAKEFGLVPVYFDSLPNSENVWVLTSTTLRLPVLSPGDAEHQQKQIRKVKRSLSQLLSVTKNSAQSFLDNFTSEINELSDIHADKQSIGIQIYILDFPSMLQRELHIALLVTDNLTNPRQK